MEYLVGGCRLLVFCTKVLESDARPARLTVSLSDLVWDSMYAPIAHAVRTTADRLNTLQFLTIRRYLVLMFAALVILLAITAVTT